MHLELIYLEGQVGHAIGKTVVDALQILLSRLKSQQVFPLLDPELAGCDSVSFLHHFHVVVGLLG